MSRLDVVVTKASLRCTSESFELDAPAASDSSLVEALDALWSRVGEADVSEISVRSESPGVVVLGDSMMLRPILWSDDGCSEDDAAWCNKKYPSEWWVERIGETVRSVHGITKLSWIHRTEPQVWSQMSRICGVDDYVRWRMLGGSIDALVITPRTIASMGLGSVSRAGADGDILALLDSEMDWRRVIPRVVPEGAVAGVRSGIAFTA